MEEIIIKRGGFHQAIQFPEHIEFNGEKFTPDEFAKLQKLMGGFWLILLPPPQMPFNGSDPRKEIPNPGEE